MRKRNRTGEAGCRRTGTAGGRSIRNGLTAVLLGLGLLVVTACGGGGGGSDEEPDRPGGGKGEQGKAAASRAVVTIEPGDGASDVATVGGLKVTAQQGTLSSVVVKDAENKQIDGRLARGGTLWQPERALAAATKYSVKAVAKDAEGREAARSADFTTVVPKDTFIGYFTPEDGSTVGVGMPVSLNFNRAIADPEAVAAAVEVTTEPEVEVRGHWFGNQRYDLRPRTYWKPGTKVTLELRLNGVEGADGVYGTQERKVSFTIGRSQVSVVDAKKKTMTVTRDGRTLRTIPITTGAPGTETWNGKMVISEKHKVTRMDGATVGFGGEYDIKDVPHAMRLSTSGTFIHGNYWAGQATFGSANVSHGCIGLHDARGGGDKKAPGAWFYAHSMVGDVVEVKNSKDRTIQPDNGLNGWNMPWSDWGTSS